MTTATSWLLPTVAANLLVDVPSTADWTPPKHEFRPSSLGACEQYAHYKINDEEEEVLDLGREIMFAAGHAAEEAWIHWVNKNWGWNVCHGVDLNNGFGGTCHPDGVDWTTRTIYELKHTAYKKPAPYHVAQISWYMMRMANETGRNDWKGVVVLCDKFGKEPLLVEIPFPDADFQWELYRRALAQRGEVEPQRMCESYEQATTAARYYDRETPCGSRTKISCPYADRCFPDDVMDGFES